MPCGLQAYTNHSCMASTLDADNPFVQWLTDELDTRRWSRADLAREIDAHPAVITKVMNRESALGVDLAKRIAAALEVPQIDLFRVAGLIDDDQEGEDAEEEIWREMARILARLPAERQSDALRWLESYADMVAREARQAKADANPRKAKGTA